MHQRKVVFVMKNFVDDAGKADGKICPCDGHYSGCHTIICYFDCQVATLKDRDTLSLRFKASMHESSPSKHHQQFLPIE